VSPKAYPSTIGLRRNTRCIVVEEGIVMDSKDTPRRGGSIGVGPASSQARRKWPKCAGSCTVEPPLLRLPAPHGHAVIASSIDRGMMLVKN
jgi:hypothetical protein